MRPLSVSKNDMHHQGIFGGGYTKTEIVIHNSHNRTK